MTKKRIGTNAETGEPVYGEPIEIDNSEELWNEYRLSDGTVLKVKLVALKVYRSDAQRNDGSPVYVLHSQNVMSVEPPEESVETGKHDQQEEES